MNRATISITIATIFVVGAFAAASFVNVFTNAIPSNTTQTTMNVETD